MNPRKLSRPLFPRLDSRQFFDNLKPPSQEEMQHNLFENSQSEFKPEYLQMPIKLEQDQISRDKRRRIEHSQVRSSSHSSSQKDDDELEDFMVQSGNFPYKAYNQELLMNPASKMEMIDEILMPHDQIREMYPEDYCLSPVPFEAIPNDKKDIKQEEISELSGASIQKRRQKLQQQKKDLQAFLSTLRLFNQTMSVAMNFHRLYKKDTLSKYFNTIHNVVLKETKKIDVFIAEEQSHINESLRKLAATETNIKIEWEELSDGHQNNNKDLFSTMIGEEGYKEKHNRADRDD